MYKLQEQAGAVILKDPAVATMAMGLGVGVGNSAQNNGRMFITLKPLEERDASAFAVIARLRPQLAKIPGLRVYLQAAQDVTVGARASRTQFQYTLQDANLDELNAWAPKILDKLRALPDVLKPWSCQVSEEGRHFACGYHNCKVCQIIPASSWHPRTIRMPSDVPD